MTRPARKARAKRCPYVGMLGTQCVLVAGDDHEAVGHTTDDVGAFKTPAAWRRALDGGRFRKVSR